MACIFGEGFIKVLYAYSVYFHCLTFKIFSQDHFHHQPNSSLIVVRDKFVLQQYKTR